jgi:hypothetical protein
LFFESFQEGAGRIFIMAKNQKEAYFNEECVMFVKSDGDAPNKCNGLETPDCKGCSFAKTKAESDAEELASLQRRLELGMPLTGIDKAWLNARNAQPGENAEAA